MGIDWKEFNGQKISMDFELDFTLSAQENAELYYKKAKKLAQKKEGAEKAVKELEAKLKEAGKEVKVAENMRIDVSEKEWYEKFHWFFTSEGMLVIGGRDAQQNELINSRYFDESDLFFHADIFGASFVVLKNGENAGANSKEEAAQFAGCYSSAWERMLSTIDVYSLRRSQVSKSTNKGSLGAGSFLLKGEREWFKNTKLELAAVNEKKFIVMPSLTLERSGYKNFVIIKQGKMKKSDAAKQIAKMLGYADIDRIMQNLPAGTFAVEFKNAKAD